MTNTLKSKVIIPAWKIIEDDSKAKKFYMFPGLLSIIFLTILLVYQSIYTYVVLFGNKEKVLHIILKFFQSDYAIEVVTTAIIFFVIYFLLIPIYEGGLIRYLHSKNTGGNLSTGDAFGQGLYRFFPLFEYNNMFSEFKIISILNGFLFTLRFLGIKYINILSYVFLALLFLGIIINILFSYSKYIIVLENKGVIKAISKSSKITILNIRRTTKLYFLILILNLRVIFNFIIFLSFPIIIVLIIGLITTKIFLIVAITILSLLFITFILALGYITAVLEVFTTAIWYYAYVEYREKIRELENEEEK